MTEGITTVLAIVGACHARRRGGKHRYADILFRDLKLIIEMNGDYWHCNPKSYDPGFIHHKKGITAKKIWKEDAQRVHELETVGYSVEVVWESEWKNDREGVLQRLVERIDLINVQLLGNQEYLSV